MDTIIKTINKEPVFEEKRNMRTAEEIMKDYGLDRKWLGNGKYILAIWLNFHR